MASRIDLAKFRSGASRVFAGRDRGKMVRKSADVARFDEMPGEIVEVYVPEDTFSVNSSFFLGMFGDSIRRLGAAGFRERYRFVGKPIHRTVEDGIQDALKQYSPLALA